MSVSTNAARLAAEYRRRQERLREAARRGLRQAAIAVDAAQVENLSGAGEPGSYPVPVRTGRLRGGHFFDVIDSPLAVVGNTTEYAAAIHSDRPFLDDAAQQVDFVGIMAVEVSEALA